VIIAYIAFLLVGIVAFILAYKLKMVVRLVVAIATFVILSLAFTAAVIYVGDKPADDATIYKK
jgi:hypothetical protein